MTPRFFGGSSAKNGRVHLLKATSFKQLVENYLLVPVPIQMTRADFLAHPDRDDIKDGDFICAASYAEDECKRVNHTATAVNLVIIDMDEGQFVKDFFESPEALYHALRNYNFCAWLTAKHTPDAPRMKIAIEVSPCAPEHHRRIALHLLSLLGIPRDFKGQRETLTLSLPQYRPVSFMKEDTSAVIASRLDGVPVQESECPEPVDDENADRRYATTENSDLLTLLHLPDYGITVEDIREPLFKIDPDCEYKVWCFTACALRHQFQDEEQARAAFEMWNEWSSGGTKYKGEKATYLKWKSFNPYPVGRPPVTLGTLYKLAVEAGWDNSKLAKKVSVSVEEWIAGCTDANTLMTEGPKRIAELPFKNELVEEALAKLLGDAVKRVGGTAVSTTTIKKQIDKVRRKEAAEASEDKPSWLLPFCFIGPRNQFYHTLTSTTYSPEAFNNSFSRYLLGKPDPDEPESSRPAILPQHKALNDVKIKVVDDTIYDPRKENSEAYFEAPDGKWYVNTFTRKSLPTEEPALAVKAGNLFKRLLKWNLVKQEHRRMFIDFFAWCIQRQGHKVKWAILFQGAEGCGKGTLLDCVRAAVGSKNWKTISASAIASDFNDWRQGAMFVNPDEVKSPGKNRFEVTNKFKDAITNDVVTVNEKFKNIANIPNVTNYVFTTNYMDAIAIDAGDRRYFILQSACQTKDQVEALNASGLFEEIREMIELHPGAFRSFFLSHEVSPDFPVHGPAPETQWRRDIIEEAKNPLQVLIERLVADEEEPLIGDDVIHYGRLENLTEYAARHNAKVSHYLRQLGYTKYDSDVVIEGYPKSDVWVHTRRYFEELGEPEELLTMRVKNNSDI